MALLCAACFIAHLSPAVAQTPSIQFTVEVPSAPAEMQIYKLAAARVPLEFLKEKLSADKLPALKLEQKNYVARGATGQSDLDKVRVFADPVSGDTHLIPNLADLVSDSAAARQRVPEEKLQDFARTALTDVRFIPRDVTEERIGEAVTVMGSATTHSPTGGAQTSAEPRVVMTIVPALRYAGGFRVYGRGSHAAVSLANDGLVVGALRRWRTASLGERIRTSITAEQVRADIERQLAPQVKREGTRAIVDKIEVAYYDGNANRLQPVYYFEATVQPANKRISDIKVAGYVPIGKALEPIPDLAAAPTGERPGVTKSGQPQAALNTAPTPGDITLGEFANQDWPTSSAYLDMANNFFSGLASGSQPVSRTLWWTAYTWQVVGPQSKDWLNAVNVAYTEPHGDWLINSTLSNCCEIWNVADIGTGGNPGYGAAAGGVLATWIIMSCEVIPSAYDRQYEIGGSGNPGTAFDAWWPVFQGLHNVIGFRTIMFYPDDALNYGFGSDAAHGGDVNAAWFDEVAAIDGNDGTYNSQHLIGNPVVHYDRASTMIDARDLGQSIFSVGAQSASSTLWNFWMGN
ncbi:MAG: DUF6345 domain-containing protein [Candidatus Korobacteraceae bacterium]|jgi:hypothetical protein